jgi:hypothetical protein
MTLVLASPWWPIAPAPQLDALLPDLNEDAPRTNEPNDHTIFQDADGAWHVWACVRHTRVGRLLCHWQARTLTQSPWTFCHDCMRADRAAGESRVAWRNQEFLQSPFVVRHQATWFMFYGGYAGGHDPAGRPTADYNAMENQICLMTSPDGRSWTRHRNADGTSRVFAGPGAVRDPFVTCINGLWHIYYSGHHERNRACAGIYLRTSPDLLHWSDWRVVHHDPSRRPDGAPVIPESPVVLERAGQWLLFRTGAAPNVVSSASPYDFGIGRAPAHGFDLPAVAPELVRDRDGSEYISTIHTPATGYCIQLARVRWA